MTAIASPDRPSSSIVSSTDASQLSSVLPPVHRSATPPEPVKLRLGLEWFLNPDHLPFLIAEEEGWLKDAGIKLELIEPDDHLDAFAAIEAGEMDVAITEPLHLVEDRAKGRDAVAFARFLHTNGGVMFLAQSGIERPRDMANRRLQYPGAPGPGGPAIVNTMIEADGGAPSTFVPVNNGFMHTAALLADPSDDKHADMATLAFYNFEVVQARYEGHDARFFALKDWGVPDFCQLILIASRDRLEQDPAPFVGLVDALKRGLDVIHQNPARARALFLKKTATAADDGLMQAIMDATLPCFTFDLGLNEPYWQRLAAWMRTRGLVEVDVDPAKCFSHQFL